MSSSSGFGFGKKKGFLRRQPQSEDMSLQITSMADIFTIILVFLLKGYATNVVNVAPSAGMLIPSAMAADAPVEALKVEISENGVSVEGQPAAELKSFTFASADLAANGSSKTLSKALDRERQRQLLIAKTNTDVKVDAKIMVVADRRVPYATVKSVLASAAVNGYTDFKLAVIQNQ